MADLVIVQGTDPDIRIKNVADSTGTLITNWVGFTARGQIRERADSATVLHEWISTGGSPNITFVGSDVKLLLPKAVSSAWTWDHARYDVELTSPTGDTARIAEGHVIVKRETTR